MTFIFHLFWSSAPSQKKKQSFHIVSNTIPYVFLGRPFWPTHSTSITVQHLIHGRPIFFRITGHYNTHLWFMIMSAQQLSDNCWKHTFSLPISAFSTLGVSHVMRYINLRYLLTYCHATYLHTLLTVLLKTLISSNVTWHNDMCNRRVVSKVFSQWSTN